MAENKPRQELKVSGQTLYEKRPGVLQMDQSALDAAFDGHGVTKDVRSAMKQAETCILNDTMKSLDSYTRGEKNPNDAVARLGTGDDRLEMRFQRSRKVTVPPSQKGETPTKKTISPFVDVRMEKRLGPELRETQSQIASDMEQVHGD